MDGSRSYHQSWKKRKNNTYENLFRNYIFVSITVETFFFSWGPTVDSSLFQKFEGISKKKEAVKITIQRGKSRSIMDTLEPPRKLLRLF